MIIILFKNTQYILLFFKLIFSNLIRDNFNLLNLKYFNEFHIKIMENLIDFSILTIIDFE